MCDILNIKQNREQREAFTLMYAKLVLSRYLKALEKKEKGYPQRKELKDAFEKTYADSKEKLKDWAFPRCCTEFDTKDEKDGITKFVIFNDFMEEVTNTKGGFSSLVTPKDISVQRIKQTIIDESVGFPIIESIRLGIKKYDLEDEKVATALTRLFYFSQEEQDTKLYDEDKKVINNEDKNPTMSFRFSLLLTLLVKENICPHFSIFAGFFTCFQNCSESKSNEVASRLVFL